MICSVCQQENVSENLFCSKCMSPIAVQKLADYTQDDKQFILALLLDNLARMRMKSLNNPIASSFSSSFFDEYLNIYWLRPETAVWRTIEADILTEHQCLQEPLLDLGCGDGINISIVQGNKFGLEFDSFQSVQLEYRDIYDYFDPEYRPILTHQSPLRIAAGIDIKETQVLKARRLGTYKEVLLGDIHHLPWQGPTFKTVYSNVIKDFEPVQPILQEVHRVLVENGTLVLTTPNENFKKNLHFINAAQQHDNEGNSELAAKFRAYDRGRSVYSATQKTAEQWTSELEQAGFVIQKIIPYISPELIQLFDIGTRVFSLDAIKKYLSLRQQGLGVPMKQLSIPLIKGLFLPYLQQDGSGSFMIIIAKKGNTSVM